MASIAKIVSETQFRCECVEAGKPGILVGGVAHWPAVSRWTPDYLTERLCHKKVEVFTSADGKFEYGDAADVAPPKDRMSFGDIATSIANGSARSRALYVMQKSIDADLPGLASDIQMPAAAENVRAFPFFWFGSAGNVTPTHYDSVNNFFAQILGRKRFTLYDPEQSEALYPVRAEARFSHVARVDVEKPDFDRFPMFRDADAMQCDVNPGDLLFLPAFFWHHVRSLDIAVSVTFYWPPRFQQCLAPPCLRDLRTAYLHDRLASVGSPITDYPGGLINAARRALDLGHADFAVLLAGGAIDRFSRSASATEIASARVQTWLATAQSVAAGCSLEADARSMIEEIEEFFAARPNKDSVTAAQC